MDPNKFCSHGKPFYGDTRATQCIECDIVWHREMLTAAMTTIRVTFANGHSLVTGINGTPAEIRAYYLGQRFELDETKPTVEAVRIDCLDPISGTPCVNGRIA